MIILTVIATLLTAFMLVSVTMRVGNLFPLDDRPAGSWFVVREEAKDRLSGAEADWRYALKSASESDVRWAELGEQLDRLDVSLIGGKVDGSTRTSGAARTGGAVSSFSADAIHARIEALESELDRHDRQRS